MALADLFFNRRPSFKGLVGLGQIQMDCSTSETHSAGVTKTRYAVEGGARYTDHIRPLPPMVSITGIISDAAPISFAGLSASGFDPARSKTAWRRLNDLWESGLPFTLVTSLATYANYMPAEGYSLVVTRTNRSDQSIEFTATIEKWRVSYTTFVESVAAEAADAIGSEAANAAQSASTAAEAVADAASAAV